MARPKFSFLSEPEIQEIHSAALRILEATGVALKHEEVLGHLKDVGCVVSSDSMVVRFPPELVIKYTEKVPRSFPLGKRDAGSIFQMKIGNMFTRPQSGCPNVLDLDTGGCRPATQTDAVNLTRLVDGLEHVDFCASLLYPWDVPPAIRDINVLLVMLNNTSKHCYIQPYNGDTARYMSRMAETLRSSKQHLAQDPPLTFILGGTSPLLYTRNELDVLLEAAEAGIPVMIGSTPIAGATAPVTIAGQILLQHAENLAGLVIAQVLRPRLPVTYAARPSYMDMRTANAIWGNIEWGMATAAIGQLAHAHGFLLDVVGLSTDSKVCDEQAGIEKAANALFGVLSYPNVLAGVGFIETILTGSLEQTVIDNDICGMIKRVHRGIEVDDDRLAEALIGQVGIAGNYLTENHTIKYFRTETFEPKVFDRQNRDRWKALGSHDTIHRAKNRVLQILKEHVPRPLDKALAKELQHIYESARNELVESG